MILAGKMIGAGSLSARQRFTKVKTIAEDLRLCLFLDELAIQLEFLGSRLHQWAQLGFSKAGWKLSEA